MPQEARTGVLRILSEGGVRLVEIREYLAAVEDTYNGLLLFQNVIDGLRRWEPHSFPFPPPIWWPWLAIPVPRKRGKPVFLTADSVSQFIAPRERLVLLHVRLESPGFWDFAGQLNPLEVIRQFLVDRHERRKDREYREAAEAERLRLENEILKNKVIRERLAMARDLGATEDDLAILLNQLLYGPLSALGQYQDRGLIVGLNWWKRIRRSDGLGSAHLSVCC